MSIILAIAIFSIIVIIHELGHFLLAKSNGIQVEEFSVGMGPRLVSTVKGGTRYSWKLLPIGGSCMMLGEDSSTSEAGSFGSKPVWARISVIIAGPLFNFVLAFLLSMIVIGIAGYDPAYVTSVNEGSPAEAAGLQENDEIVSLNGRKISIGREVDMYFLYHGTDEPVTIKVVRDGEKIDLTFEAEEIERTMLGISYTPDENVVVLGESAALMESGAFELAGMQEGDRILGIDGTEIRSGEELAAYFDENPLEAQPMDITYERDGVEETVSITPTLYNYTTPGFDYNLYRVDATPLQIVKYSYVDVKYWIKSTLEGLTMLVRGKMSVDNLSGPVGVVNVIGEAYEQSRSSGMLMVVLNMLNLSILLSANLGVMNLLPIPALDGGRLIFLLYEAIRRKPVDPDKEGMIHFVGFVLLMVLMVVVMFNDIRRLF